FAMAASVSRARALADQGRPEAAEARRLADLFCRMARRRVRRLFAELWDNDDVMRYRAGVDVLEGRHAWLERRIVDLAGRAPASEERAEAEPGRVAAGVS